MRLQTRLALAFLVLAVLPLGGIVLYSYAASEQAFRDAVWAEGEAISTEMEARLASTRERIRRQITGLGDLSTGPDGEMPPIDQIVRRIQAEGLPWVESLEFVPEVERRITGLPGAAPAAGDEIAVEIETRALRLPPGKDKELANLEKLKIPARIDVQGEGKHSVVVFFHHPEHGAPAPSGHLGGLGHPVEIRRQPSPADRVAVEESRKRTERLLGEELSCPVTVNEQVLGKVRAHIQAQALLHSVLGNARRDRGEIPFALDEEGKLYVTDPRDRETLRDVPVSCRTGKKNPDWIVVARKEADSGLCFGVARPIGAPLQQMRRAAAQNFVWGLGLVGLCFAGIFPLSRHITRHLAALMAGVERIARGDLSARVAVRSRDEFGRLGEAFNRMAGELSDHQERLVEQAIGRRLLEAEHSRQCEELEEARRFQLSLLPRELPRRQDLEVAVHVRTATEVGGDYYDFLEGEDGTLTLAIGDATGHGSAAGTMVTVIKGLFTARAGDAAPADFLQHSNAVIRRMQLGRMAMALAVVRIHGRTLRISSAGMPPLLIHRAATGALQEVCLEGTPLGSLGDPAYVERAVDLAPGDTVLLMTDGFPELLSVGGEPLGYPRTGELFAAESGKAPAALLAGLAAAGDSWCAGCTPADDVTFVAFRMR
jgi:serine phosphatase RsbU (regulator of sigma subunit)